MNTVDLRRTRRWGVACAAVTAFAFTAPQPASAEVSNPNLVPADSAYIMSIPSGPAFWAAWEGNGLYAAYNKAMAMPDVESKTAGFKKELSIIESSLGFKIDGKTLSQVFANADIYIQDSKTSAIASAAIFKISDQEKLSKLIDLAEKAAVEAHSSDDETSDTKSDDSATTSPIVDTEYAGVKIKSVKMEDDENEFVYARTADFLFVANSTDGIKKLIDRTKGATEGSFATSEDYKKVDAALASEKGEFYIYGNQEKAMDMQNNESAPEEVTKAIQAMMDDLAPMSYFGASIKIAPKEIASYSYGLLKAGTSGSLVMKNPGDKPLTVVSYVPEGTILSASTALFDAKGLYNVVIAGAESARAEVKKASDDDSEATSDDETLEAKMKSVEPMLGFSVKNDFIPALGNEVGFAINKVEFSGLIPQVDATIMLGVADKEKMTKVVDSLNKLGTGALAAKSDSGKTPPSFAVEEIAGQKVRTIEIGVPGYDPGYVLTDDFLILGSTKSALKNSLEANASGKNLGSSEAFKSLGHSISANAFTVQYSDLSKMVDIASRVAKSLSGSDEISKYMEVLDVLDAAGSSSRIEDGAAVSHGVLKLK